MPGESSLLLFCVTLVCHVSLVSQFFAKVMQTHPVWGATVVNNSNYPFWSNDPCWSNAMMIVIADFQVLYPTRACLAHHRAILAGPCIPQDLGPSAW